MQMQKNFFCYCEYKIKPQYLWLKVDMEGLKREMAELRAKEDRVKELIEWKRRVDDVASPLQLRELQKEVARLQDFKVKATTAFVAAQMVVAAAFALLKLF